MNHRRLVVYFVLITLIALVTATPSVSQDERSGKLRNAIIERLHKRRALGTMKGLTVPSGMDSQSMRYVTKGTVLHDSIKRTYALVVPPSVNKDGHKVPLVLVLHGGGGNSAFAMKSSGFTDKAIKEGFIVAYPEGTGPTSGMFLTWNAKHCCGTAMRNGVDDVGFVSKLIDKLIKEQPVDPDRIYVTGMSNGGMMTHRLATELSDKIAAIAPVVATLFGDEKQPANPVPAIIFNGLLDKSVVYTGGTHGGRFADSWDNSVKPLNVEAQASFWAKANGSSSQPQIEETKTVRHLYYKCPQDKDVEMYVVKDGGHAWPGGRQGSKQGDVPSQSINATDLMWEFFKRHHR